MQKVDSSRLDLAREFKANPFGPYSADLEKLLKLLRWEPVDGRFFAVQPERDGAWFLARTTGPKGHPIEIFRDRPYRTIAEAQWAVFRKRWEQHTGTCLHIDSAIEDDPPTVGELTMSAAHQPILGYADKFSVETGQAIAFKVSSERTGTYRARILRIRCGDKSGVGFKAAPVEAEVDGEYAARRQKTASGSYVEIEDAESFRLRDLSLVAYIWATTPRKGWQALLGNWTDGGGYALAVDNAGALALRLGDGKQTAEITTATPLLERHWYLIAASFDSVSGEAWVGQRPLHTYARFDTRAERTSVAVVPARGGVFRMAAWNENGTNGAFYNGKIDSPMVLKRALTADERANLLSGAEISFPDGDTAAHWDFSKEISTDRIIDVSPHGRHGFAVNLPARAMKGWNWDGSEYVWMHKPEHYGAIHFHDDDLYDCKWETDFSWSVPNNLPSGLYAAHLEQERSEDFIPFVVRPPKGRPRAELALLLPTASYWAYANWRLPVEWREREQVTGSFAAVDPASLFIYEHPEYGCSLYDRHSDGSGVCYSSRLRPLINMRPHGRLWQLPADTHIIDWLEEKKIAFDIITEDEVDAEGVALLASYRCVMTGTHPEYPSKRVIDAYGAFQSRGGRFIYMGGNGFYWRVSYHPAMPGVIEMRRGEDGIRSWLAEGGEYYHSFTGELGGMWRRMGHAPQSVAGTGMTAQGFDRSTYYERTPASFDPRSAFIFDGIAKDERIGDFGRIGGGAAGWEIDRADSSLGTPPHALVVATASNFSSSYHWMKEEMTHTHSAITGETCPYVRCDIVFYETPRGGAVFSTSSIAWAGALDHNRYDNNVSRITENVVRRFLDPAPF